MFSLLQINSKITSLNLKGNDINQEGMEYICKMMSENVCITELVSVLFTVSRLHGLEYSVLVSEFLKVLRFIDFNNKVA